MKYAHPYLISGKSALLFRTCWYSHLNNRSYLQYLVPLHCFGYTTLQLLPLNVGYMTSSHCCLDWMACCIDLEYSYLRFNLSECGL